MSGARSSIALAALVALLVGCSPDRPMVSGPHPVLSWALEPGSYDVRADIVEDGLGLYDLGAVVLDEVAEVRVGDDWVTAEGPSGVSVVVRIDARFAVDAEGQLVERGAPGATTRLRLDLSWNGSTLIIGASPGQRVEPTFSEEVLPTAREADGRIEELVFVARYTVVDEADGAPLGEVDARFTLTRR